MLSISCSITRWILPFTTTMMVMVILGIILVINLVIVLVTMGRRLEDDGRESRRLCACAGGFAFSLAVFSLLVEDALAKGVAEKGVVAESVELGSNVYAGNSMGFGTDGREALHMDVPLVQPRRHVLHLGRHKRRVGSPSLSVWRRKPRSPRDLGRRHPNVVQQPPDRRRSSRFKGGLCQSYG